MAETELTNPDTDGGPSHKTIWVILIIIAIVILINLLPEGSKDIDSVEMPTVSAESNPANNSDSSDDGDLDSSAVEASMTRHRLRQNEIDAKSKERDKDLLETVKKIESEFSNYKTQSDIRLRELAELVITKNDSSVNNSYNDENQSGFTSSNDFDSFETLELTDGTNAETYTDSNKELKPERSKYGDNYYVFSEGNTATIDGKTTKNDNYFDTTLNSLENTFGDPIDKSKNNINDSFDYANQGMGNKRLNEPVLTVGNKSQETGTKKLIIPELSFASVTPLHGVACPIGASVTQGESSGALPGRPVIFAVTGTFRAPNGKLFELGTAHLWGLCTARRTSDSDVGRAEIQISKLSYWDENGGAQHMAIDGYIVDDRDHELDVAGIIDKASIANIGKESFAAAMAAFASTLSEEEFTTVTSDSGSTQKFLTGSAGAAAGAKGIAGLFMNIANYYRMESQASVDTVRIPPSIPLKFYSELEINVEVASDPFESNMNLFQDVLI